MRQNRRVDRVLVRRRRLLLLVLRRGGDGRRVGRGVVVRVGWVVVVVRGSVRHEHSRRGKTHQSGGVVAGRTPGGGCVLVWWWRWLRRGRFESFSSCRIERRRGRSVGRWAVDDDDDDDDKDKACVCVWAAGTEQKHNTTVDSLFLSRCATAGTRSDRGDRTGSWGGASGRERTKRREGSVCVCVRREERGGGREAGGGAETRSRTVGR